MSCQEEQFPQFSKIGFCIKIFLTTIGSDFG